MRRFLRDDVVSQTDIDRLHPGWWDLVLTEFERYCAYDPDFATQENARDSIKNHMAGKKIKEHGGKYEDYRPAYLREGVWRKFCSWWRTEQFRKRSISVRDCRGKVQIPHTSGSYSFERRRRDYVVKHKKEPSVLEHFKELHTLRENGALISPEAKEIMDHYEKLCADKNIDPSKTSLELWVKAVGGVRKNKILGYPRIRACDVLGTTRSTRRVGE
ncbi:hypothetical protein POM88_050699 [Heracleum sosnowskyi]|uniref:Transposase n=1 Tax=Heracleum sosnowskyi TaxID=360622 RepID=A0AAD8GZC1_9APIA|nr:hypothetical protein POM88_050699 [Heracleum sosnowskyi]